MLVLKCEINFTFNRKNLTKTISGNENGAPQACKQSRDEFKFHIQVHTLQQATN